MGSVLTPIAQPEVPPEQPVGSRLESTFAPAYMTWKKQPTPQHAAQLLQKLRPVINKAVTTYGGQAPGPVLRGRAKRLILDALPSYDPMKASLQTHLLTRLQRLRRYAAKASQIIRVPERLAIARSTVTNAENELHDQLGRPATSTELADYTGLSTKRIAEVRRLASPFAEGSMSDDQATDTALPAVQRSDTDLVRNIAEFVYDDLAHPLDRLILEYGLGLHGRQRLNKSAIAKRLSLTPSAVSQRAMKIQAMIDATAETGVL